MIDLNHQSGCQYEARAEDPVSVLPSTRRSTRRSSPETARSRRGTTSARPDSAANACGRSNTIISPSRKTRAASSNRARCASSRPAIVREDVVAAWLRAAGFDLRTQRQDGRQFGFSSLAGRFRGHIDGCLVAGPAPIEFPALWENKALGASSWKDVVKRGVVIARPIYAAQIALYQAYLDLPNPALFTALNRDTFELHCELVPFDAALAQRDERPRGAGRARQRMRRSCCRALPPTGARPSAEVAEPAANGTAPVPGRTAAGGRRHDRHHAIRHPGARDRRHQGLVQEPDQGATGVSAVRLCRNRQDPPS